MHLAAPSKFYTVAELAEAIGVKDDVVHAWIASRELVAMNVAQKRNGKPRWRITQEAFDAFQAARTTTPKTVTVQRRQRKSAVQPRSWIK